MTFWAAVRARVVLGGVGAAAIAAGRQREEQPSGGLDDAFLLAVPRPLALPVAQEGLFHAFGSGLKGVRHVAGTVVQGGVDADGQGGVVAVHHFAVIAETQEVVVVADLFALEALLDERERLYHRRLAGGVEPGQHRDLRKIEIEVLESLEVLQMDSL